MDSADGLKAALENDAVTDIEVVGSFAYETAFPKRKHHHKKQYDPDLTIQFWILYSLRRDSL